MLLIGITGGIASGKTEVAKVFQKKGAIVLSGDEIGKDVVEKNPALLKKLIKTFGKEILDSKKRLKRKKLGEIAFSSYPLTKKLNEIVHPYLLKNLKLKINNLKRKKHKGVVVIDAALIVEWGFEKDLDYLIFVDCPEKERIKRLIQKKTYTKKEAEQRIKAQLPEAEKRKRADFIINNKEGLKELRKKANSLWKNIIGK
ncbi:MAG: hypothetical protein AMJ90_06025 [candidate division Zixibacteria bacterium SM23_73_2]|nr:MAG: hypothetical protein AMJ90_06025 [candidate division Zixibacteria bacterium SM23_73_2]